ncbi:competence protein ComK [Vagococcus luciliae]|uniref:WYL domain-containing protein n=1 Tax=Vagococcus luciliae TaxID=2920380 RepID=A0ABY5P1U0_9ENTE|nr:competence protein ComK [Vagococcus luciliae]UUV99887.1 hypothetical protein G314FT_20560 [Vagococcus luciliae]
MKTEGRKRLIYEALAHGESITLNDLYNKFLPCSVKMGQTHLSDDIYFIHDISELGLAYKTLLFSSTTLPILTTSNTQTLISEYNERNQYIFQKVIHTVALYDDFSQKRYKQPMIDRRCLFVPLNGSVRKDTSFFNIMYIETCHQSSKGVTMINFFNYLSLEIDYEYKSLLSRIHEAMKYYMLYFYPEMSKMLDEELEERGRFIEYHFDNVTCLLPTIDSKRLDRCRHTVDYFLTVQQRHQTLTIHEFIEEYDSYWGKI